MSPDEPAPLRQRPPGEYSHCVACSDLGAKTASPADPISSARKLVSRETLAHDLTASPGGPNLCDPISLSLGTAAAVGGGLWSRKDALNNAQREANARNGVLSTAINGLNQDYNNINAPAFSGAVGGISPSNLKTAQDARTATIMGNVNAPSTAGQPPVQAGAPPAVAADRAARLKDAFNFVKNQGTATGKLGGYGDQWFTQNLGEQDAARKIGVGNTFANETKSLIGPEQDLAAAAAYKTPSWVPGVMQGVVGMLGSYSGRGGNRQNGGSAQVQYYPAGQDGGSTGGLDWG
jgi:hypothetical protein